MDSKERDILSSPNRFSICCTDMPESLFDKEAAIEHFGKFGNTTKIFLQPKKRSCIVDYESREAADKAVLNAGAYDGFMFDVKMNKKKRQTKLDDDPDWLPNPEVIAELAAMGRNTPTPRLNRQQKMDIDIDSPFIAPKKSKKVLHKTIEKKKVKMISKTLNSQKSNMVSLNFVDKEELKQLLGKSWISVEDKLAAIEIRNKLLRAHLPKRRGALIGCCPDMCPERERLLRQSQRQFSVYECYSTDCDGNKFDSKRAIKEYSRSSADQEEPLPHELRPELVLHFTLLYLLHYITDLSEKPETSLADWFHFMWDRLRAIRKDITQQALCSEGSVSLVESCARFHAHCAARLVDEPSSSFDQRLNTENLSKCLQSLKYMYNDLRTRGETKACKKEAEFRAYVILLNLNDSNFMWEVQQLAPEIQSSQEIAFAIDVFTAIDNNNYVKFFKLVKQTSYLNACILLRYFNDIRRRALQRIVKAYSPRGISYFPASELMEILAFENIESMEHFLDHHGLQITLEQGISFVVLDRNSFRNDMSLLIHERAINLIESKRKCSLGEIIYGAKLPEDTFEEYLPHTSFDKNGFLKKDAVLAEDQGNLPSMNVKKGINSIMEDINSEKQFNSNDIIKTASDVTEKSYSSLTNNINVQQPSSMNFVFNVPLSTSMPIASYENSNSAMTLKPKNEFSFSKPVPCTNIFQTHSNVTINNIFGNFTTNTVDEKSNNMFGVKMESQPNIFSSKSSNAFLPLTSSNTFLNQQSSIFGGNTLKETKIENTNLNIFSNPIYTKSLEQIHGIEGDRKETDDFIKKKLIEKENEIKLEELQKEKQRQEEIKKQQEKYDKELKEIAEKKKREELLKQRNEMEKIKKEQEKQEMERKQKEFEDYVNTYAYNAAPEILSDVVKEMCCDMIENEINILDNVKASALSIYDDLIHDICLEECKEGVRVVKRLHELRTNIIVRSVVAKWKNIVMKSRRQHLLLVNTPFWTPSVSPPPPSCHQIDILKRMRNFHCGKKDVLKVPKKLNIDKIDVFEVVKKVLLKRSQEISSFSLNIYWKIAISVSDKTESESKYVDLLQNIDTMITGNSCKDDIIYLKEDYFHKKICLCISKMPSTSKKHIEGLNGIIFFGYIEKSEIVLKQLKNFLEKRHELESIPIAFVLISKEENNLSQFTDRLEKFKNKNSILLFNIFPVIESSECTFSLNVNKALKWLARHQPKKPALEINYLHSFLDQCIGKELWCRFKLGIFSPVGEAFKDPKIIIHLYNEAIEKTSDILCSDELLKYPSFAEEFQRFLPMNSLYPKDYEYFPLNWKSNIPILKELLSGIKMQTYDEVWPPTNWQSFQYLLQQFITNLNWFNDIEVIYFKVLSVFVNSDINKSDNGNVDSSVERSSWLNVMEILVSEKINDICSKMTEVKAVYKKHDLNMYRVTPWWYKSPHTKNICEFENNDDFSVLDDTLDELGIVSAKKAKLNDSMDSLLDEDFISSILTELDNSNHQKNICKRIIADIEKTIECETARQTEIESLLNSVLENE